ncbi:hypothetical protein GCM10009075_35510 [Sphingomonas trueperi]
MLAQRIEQRGARVDGKLRRLAIDLELDGQGGGRLHRRYRFLVAGARGQGRHGGKACAARQQPPPRYADIAWTIHLGHPLSACSRNSIA